MSWKLPDSIIRKFKTRDMTITRRWRCVPREIEGWGEGSPGKPDVNNQTTVDFYFGRATLEEAVHAASPKAAGKGCNHSRAGK